MVLVKSKLLYQNCWHLRSKCSPRQDTSQRLARRSRLESCSALSVLKTLSGILRLRPELPKDLSLIVGRLLELRKKLIFGPKLVSYKDSSSPLSRHCSKKRVWRCHLWCKYSCESAQMKIICLHQRLAPAPESQQWRKHQSRTSSSILKRNLENNVI